MDSSSAPHQENRERVQHEIGDEDNLEFLTPDSNQTGKKKQAPANGGSSSQQNLKV